MGGSISDMKGGQIVSTRVDEQLMSMVTNDIIRAGNIIGDGLMDMLRLEIASIVEMIYFWFTLCYGKPTPGMIAVGVDVIDPADGKFMIFSIALKCLILRLQKISQRNGWNHEVNGSWKKRISEFLKISIILCKSISILNTVHFFAFGAYPLLLYRITGVRMKSVNSNRSNDSQLFVEAKKLLWHVFLLLASATAITVDWQAIKYFLFFQTRSFIILLSNLRRNYLTLYTESPNTREQNSNNLNDINEIIEEQEVNHINSTNQVIDISNRNLNDKEILTCSKCNSFPAEIPHRADCEHIFCYLCLHALLHTPHGTLLNQQIDSIDDGKGVCPVCYKTISKSTAFSIVHENE